MTGVVPNNPPALQYRYEISSNKHDLDGSYKSTISVFTPLPDCCPVATKYLTTSSKKKTFWNRFVIMYETHPDSEICTVWKTNLWRHSFFQHKSKDKVVWDFSLTRWVALHSHQHEKPTCYYRLHITLAKVCPQLNRPWPYDLYLGIKCMAIFFLIYQLSCISSSVCP